MPELMKKTRTFYRRDLRFFFGSENFIQITEEVDFCWLNQFSRKIPKKEFLET